jgi:uncharacterized protein involved in exopolysaccharide biosynthesis
MTTDGEGDYRILKIIYSRRLFIISVTLLAVIGAAIFSSPYFIPPRYQSEVIIYPPSTNSNRMLIERDARFGSEKEIDEQIQLLGSSIVRDSMIRKYELKDHYDVDSAAADKQYRLHKIYNDRVKIERTRYNSISVTVTDTDPALAAAMANDIVEIGDAHKEAIIKEKLREAFDALSKNIFDLSLQIDQIASDINRAHSKEVVSGSTFYKKTNIDQLKEQLDLKELMRMARESDQVRFLEQLYLYESKLQQMATIQLSYDQALVSLNNQIPSSFIISPAEVADKKTYPVRWMIALITAISALIGSVSLVILLEKYRSVIAIIQSEK